MPEIYIIFFEIHSVIRRVSLTENQASYSVNLMYHGFNSLQVCPVHSMVSCAEMSQLVMKELL